MKKINIFLLLLTIFFSSSSNCQCTLMEDYYSNIKKDSITHLYYKNGNPFNGVDTVKGNGGYFNYFGVCYYKLGKRIKVEEYYNTESLIKHKRSEFYYDSNGVILNGIRNFLNRDGVVFEQVQYNNGCPDGIDIQFSNHEYDTNHGIYYLGYNIMGQRTGTDYYFYPDSKIKEEDKKLTDTLNMPRFRHISWYENGRIKNEYNYTLGKHTHDNPFYYLQKDAYGIVKGWYENGKIKDIGEWENNKLVGLWKYYDSNGKLRKITSYDTNKNTEEVMRYNEHGELLNQKSIKNKQELKKYLVGTWISIEDSNHIVRITNDSVIDISHSEFCIHYFPYRITDTACCSHTKGYSKSIKYFIGEAHPELVNLTPSCVGVTYIDMNYLDLTILDLYDNDAGLCLFFKRKQDTVKGK